jgi:hypothetical protein
VVPNLLYTGWAYVSAWRWASQQHESIAHTYVRYRVPAKPRSIRPCIAYGRVYACRPRHVQRRTGHVCVVTFGRVSLASTRQAMLHPGEHDLGMSNRVIARIYQSRDTRHGHVQHIRAQPGMGGHVLAASTPHLLGRQEHSPRAPRELRCSA